MGKRSTVSTWSEELAPWSRAPSGTFDEEFLNRFGLRLWQISEGDKSAAHSLHVELISRIATQTLGYTAGVETSALTSIFQLFGISRALTKDAAEADTFETIVWHVLNQHVRPFTSKWHAKSERGELDALDATDLFRAEMEVVQLHLIVLDGVLCKIRGIDGFPAVSPETSYPSPSEEDLGNGAVWRPMGKSKESDACPLRAAEESEVLKRRNHYKIDDRSWAAGIALSGGGIRSATFAMGVLVAISRRGLLQQFDYLSSVSGGGYTASFLTNLLGNKARSTAIGLAHSQLPFRHINGESELLRKIRHGASYLAGSALERFTIAMAQAQGIFLTMFLLMFAISSLSLGDYMIRKLIPEKALGFSALSALVLLVLVFVVLSIVRGRRGRSLSDQEPWETGIFALLLVPPFLASLGIFHDLIAKSLFRPLDADPTFLSVSLIVFVFSSVCALAFLTRLSATRPFFLSLISVLFVLFLESSIFQIFTQIGPVLSLVVVLGIGFIVFLLWMNVDANSTSLHGYYRRKLADAFLIGENCQPTSPLKLTEFDGTCAHFPIINCALNAPGSNDARMRGRNADLFSFSPVSTGSDLIGHKPTPDWEAANPSLDIATAMALSGAAVSPQMGLQTRRFTSFWLTLLNMRLGAWLKNPSSLGANSSRPTIRNIFHELLATGDEKGTFVQISDGGHIENLGIYELLRRRCRFIVAVDGEHDASMTFHGLTNLQRLAFIDLGITIDANLEDLRLSKTGLSRSHFQFCEIRYPLGDGDQKYETGYLVYVKLSLTGNEGEFIRRYKLDEPAFPHHSTADQFFNEIQFEAYRSLGEHIGDKMFLKAVTGLPDSQSMEICDWMHGLARSLGKDKINLEQ